MEKTVNDNIAYSDSENRSLDRISTNATDDVLKSLGTPMGSGIMRALEPRILLDAAAAATLADAVEAQAHQDASDWQMLANEQSATNGRDVPQLTPPQLAPIEREVRASQPDLPHAQANDSHLLETYSLDGIAAPNKTEIVFLDAGIKNLDNILSAISPNAKIVMLDPQSDGVEQIARALDGQSGFESIHIISHGRAGLLELGTAHLTEATINGQYAQALKTIGSALTKNGDILIYGCNFGQFASGASAVEALALATNADIAASDDLTGAASLGGDWDLERTIGDIEAHTISAQDWQGTLAPFDIAASGPPTATGGTALGATALWTNAGTVGGQAIDVTATVVSVVSGAPNVSFGTTGNDLRVIMNSAAEVVIRWEVFQSGTNQTVATFGDPNLLIKDLDGSGAPETIEVVAADAAGLSSYTVESPTNLVITSPGGTIRASGTQNQSTADSNAWVRYKWVGVSNWEVNYRAYSGGRFFDHDANGDLSFVNPNTVILNEVPTVNLDPNNSGGGTDNGGFETTFNRGGGAVSVADIDANVDDIGENDITQMQIVLAGATDGANEIITIAGQSFPANANATQAGVNIGGSSVDIAYTAATGTFTITNNTGSTNPVAQADLDALVQSITYENTLGSPTAGNRTLTFSVRDSGGIGSDPVVATVNVAANAAPIAQNDVNATNEDTAISVTAANGVITPNDTDANLDTLTVSQVNGSPLSVGNQITLASGALLTVNADGSYSYDPNASFEYLQAGQSTTDSFSYQVSDGHGGTDTASVTLTINGVNDLPVLSNDANGSSPATANNFEATYIENAVAIKLVDVDSSVTDADNDIVEMVVTLTDGKIGDTINFPSSLPGNISAAVVPLATLTAPGSITITFTGDASTTNANWNTVLQGISFLPSTNDVHNPDPADRHFTVQLSDSANATSNTTNTTIHVVPQNDPPTLDLDDDNSGGINAGNYLGTFIENSGGTPIHSNIIMSDLDNANFQSSVVTLTNPKANDQLIVNGTAVVSGDNGTVNGIGYVVSTGGSGEVVITLAADAPIADYDTALELIQFNNTSDNPDTTQRLINVVVNDGTDNSATRTAFINVNAINDAPVLDLDSNDSVLAGSGYEATYIENDPATSMADVDLGIVDPDNTQMASATIILTNAKAGDLLETGPSLSGTTTTVNTATPGQISVTITGSASVADYQTMMKAVTFRSTSESPDTTDRIINFTVNDGNIDSNTAQSTMHVVSVNDAPTLTAPIADQTSNDGNTSFSLATAGNFNDVDNATLTYTLDSAAPNWLTINGATGKITVVGAIPADASQNTNIAMGADGTYDLTVTAHDAGGLTAQDTFRITIANLDPVAVNDVSSANEDSGQSGNVITDAATGDADTAPDTDSLTVTAVTGGTIGVAQTLTYGDLTLNANGSWTFTPNANANALALGTTVNETVTYTVSDGQGGTDTATLTLSIVGTNDAPMVIDPANPAVPPADPANIIPDVSYTDGQPITTINAGTFVSDPDGDTLTFSATDLPPGLSINPATGKITGTPDADASKGGSNPLTAPGLYHTVITALDTHGASVTTSVDFNIANITPVANDDTATTDEDSPTSGNVLTGAGADTDGSPDTDPLNVSQVNGAIASVGKTIAGSSGGDFIINADGSWSFDPGTDFGGLANGQTRDTTITYQISDGNGGFDDAKLTITVNGLNDTPKIGGPLPAQILNDGQTITPIDTTTAFNNPGSVPLAYIATGLPAGLSINSATGIISGTIDNSASLGGTYPAIVSAIMANGQSVDTAVNFIVSNVDPIANNDSASTAINTPLTIAPLVNDSDGAPDGDPLNISQITTAPTNGTASINANGTITYTPNGGFTGTDTITYEVSDGQGGSDTATITLQVGLANTDIPTATPIPAQSFNDGETIAPVNIAGSFTDPNGDPLTYATTGLPQDLSIDPNTGIISGTIDTNASQSGPYTVQVTAIDPAGNQVTQPLTINVANPAPNAVNDSVVTALGTAVDVVVMTNDSDPDGDALSVPLINLQPTNGTAVINADGSVHYTPNGGFSGVDTFTYILEDANGARSEATVTVNVATADPNAPVAALLTPQTVDEGAPITPIDLSGSFTDPNGDPLRYSATSLPPGLTIDPSTGVITGTPNSDASANGPYTAQITASDPGGKQVTTPIVINVNNPAPVALADSALTAIDTPVTINVMNNDTDPDGDTFSVTGTTPPTNGSVVINADGTITYTPNAAFTGADSFTYTITDAQGASDTQTVIVTTDASVNVPVANPVFAPQAASDGTTPAAINMAKVIIDPDGDMLAWSANNLPAGLSINPVTGLISGTIDNSASQGGINSDGIYTATISAQDPGGNVQTTTIDYQITNLPPIAVNDISTADEGTTQSGNVITDATTGDGDTAPDSDAVTLTAVTGGTLGSAQSMTYGDLTVNADGSWVFIPNAIANALAVGTTVSETVTYMIDDGEGGTDAATLTINITGVNDGPVVIDPANPGTPPADSNNIIPDVTGTDGATPATINVASFINDVDGDTLTFTATDLPPGLVINAATGDITGTISASASQGGNGGAGIYNVVLTATDPSGALVTTTLTYTITNLDPVAVDDASSANEDSAQSGNVLTDATTGDRDAAPDSDPITISAVSGGTPGVAQNLTYGDLTLNVDGSWTFTPNAAANALPLGTTVNETVTYTVSDGQGGTDTATLTLSIVGVNDAPIVVATHPDISDFSGVDVTYPTAALFKDADGDILRYSATNLPTGLTIDSNTGEISGTIAGSAIADSPARDGIFNVVITADDGNGGQVTASFKYTVNAIGVSSGPTPSNSLPVFDTGGARINDGSTGILNSGGSILTTLGNITPLGDNTGIFNFDQVLTKTLSQIDPLGPFTQLGEGNHPVENMVKWVNETRDLLSRSSTIDAGAYHAHAVYLGGDAVSSSGDGQIMARSLVLEKYAMVELFGTGFNPSDWQISVNGKSAFPVWLQNVDGKAMIILRPADIEQITFTMKGSNGTIELQMDPVSGQLKMTTLKERLTQAPIFSEQIQHLASAGREQVKALFYPS